VLSVWPRGGEAACFLVSTEHRRYADALESCPASGTTFAPGLRAAGARAR
jgi:hypothetical protein